MDPTGPPPANNPTPTANGPTPIATNPLNGRPIFLNPATLNGPPLVATPTATSSTATSSLPTMGPAASTAGASSAAKPGDKIQSYSLHFAMCTDNCSSAYSLTAVVLLLFIGSIIFMVLHRKRRNREYAEEEEPAMSVATPFHGGGGPPSRDLRSPFDNRGFNSFDEYNQQRNINNNTDSYYEDDYVEGYAGVAGFAPSKDNRQSAHAGIGGFGVPKPTEPVPTLPMLNVPPPPPPANEYDPAYADYEDEWERFQQEEMAAASGQAPPPQTPITYRGGHDSTVEGSYFAPQAYEQPQHGHDVDVDEDQAFEPSPYFQAHPMQQQQQQQQQQADDEEETYSAMPMPQFEVEDYYMRDHLAADPVAPTANAPTPQINWMNENEKQYWNQYKQ